MIGSQYAHSIAELEPAHVAPRDRERPGGDVDRVHSCARKSRRARQGDRAGSGAHIEYPPHAATRDPRGEACGDELGDGRARHEHTLVDVQLEPREECAVRQVGERHTPFDALLEQRVDERAPPRGEGFAVDGAALLVRQPRRIEDEFGGLVASVVRAVSEVNACACERARAALDGGAHRFGDLRLGPCMG